MKSNNDVQEAVINYLQSDAAIIVTVLADQIKEIQWYGTDFTYPGIRVGQIRQVPSQQSNCNNAVCYLKIVVMDNNASSQKCDDICYNVVNRLHGKSFTDANGLKIVKCLCNSFYSAERVGDLLWVAIAEFQVLI